MLRHIQDAQHPKMKFTIEVSGSHINYLDLIIMLFSHHDLMLVLLFQIHRKPSFTGVSISKHSLHPKSHKLATIEAAIHRLLAIPLDHNAFEEEIQQVEKHRSLSRFLFFSSLYLSTIY